MTKTDLAQVDELRQLAGWNQTPKDWLRLLALQPTGCFVACREGRLVGTVTTTLYGRSLAWIGMMLVHPDHRRKGIARRLMQQALEYLRSRNIQCMKLDATPAGQPLYEQLGFVPEWPLHRWERSPSPENLAPAAAGDTRSFKEKDWPLVLKLDEAAFGAPRLRLLDRLVQESRHALVWPAAGPARGWGLLRSGTNSDYLGPLVCASPDGAKALIPGLLADSKHRNLTWDIPDHNEVGKAIAEALGFAPVRILTRMRLGPRTEATQPQTLFGIADPAVG